MKRVCLLEEEKITESNKIRRREYVVYCKQCKYKMLSAQAGNADFRISMKCPRCTRVITFMGDKCKELEAATPGDIITLRL